MRAYFEEFDKFEKEISVDNVFQKVLQEQIVQSLYDRLRAEYNTWKKLLIHRLSDQIPKHYIGKRRPPQRRFPFKVTGDLVSKIGVDGKWFVVERSPLRSHYKIVFKFSFSSVHAFFTNDGVNQYGRWIGWAEDVLAKNGRGGVKSARKILDEVASQNVFQSILNKALQNA